jgi:putative transcriptional regulator
MPKTKRRILPMPTKKSFVKSSRASSRGSIARDLVAGLKEAAAFARGEISLPVRIVNVPAHIDVGEVRAKLGLSQSEFASQYGFSLRTLQEWEQGRTRPDIAVRAYLTVIDRNSKAVIEALTDRTMQAGG